MIIDNTNNWTESDMEFDGLVILNSLMVPNYIGLTEPVAGTVGLIKNGNQTGFYIYGAGEYSIWTKDTLGDWSLLSSINSDTELGDLSERLGESYSWDSHTAVYFQVNSDSMKLYAFPRAGALIVDSTPSNRSDAVNLLKFGGRSYTSSLLAPTIDPSGVVVDRGGGSYWYENISDAGGWSFNGQKGEFSIDTSLDCNLQHMMAIAVHKQSPSASGEIGSFHFTFNTYNAVISYSDTTTVSGVISRSYMIPMRSAGANGVVTDFTGANLPDWTVTKANLKLAIGQTIFTTPPALNQMWNSTDSGLTWKLVINYVNLSPYTITQEYIIP